MSRWSNRKRIKLESILQINEGYRVTVWRKIETVDLRHAEGKWRIEGTDSWRLARKRWLYKAELMDALSDHYADRGS